MTSADLAPVQAALAAGDKRAARRLLKPLLNEAPTPEVWLLAADASDSLEQELGCVRRALKLDSRHKVARARYRQLQQTAFLTPPPDDLLPPLEALTDLPPVKRRVDIQAIKREESRCAARRTNRLGCAAAMLLCFSMSYVVLSLLGSPVPAQFRRLLDGQQVAPPEGTPIFGWPTPQGGIDPNAPPPPTPDGDPQTYADDAAAAGFIVRPFKTEPLQLGEPIGDVLDPGFSHEYTFNVASGEEIAIAVQFFSLTSKRVSPNVAILDAAGYNAESHCQRDFIINDGSSVAFICMPHHSGAWKLQVFGRANESTGVYFVTYTDF